MPHIALDLSLWLPLAAFLLGAFAHALSADGGRSVLEKFGLPPLPRAWLPWLTAAFGIGADAVNMLVLGKGWQEALTGAFFAMATTIFGLNATRVAHGAVGGDSGTASGSGGSSVAGPAVFVVGGGLLLTGCAAFQKAEPFLPTQADLACVAVDVERGVTDPITVATDCPHLVNVAVADIEALIGSQLAAKRAAHTALRAEACDAGALEGGK